MPISVEKQIKALSNQYLRHGGKQNRRQQIGRLTSACDWIATAHNINRLEQIGKRQIIDFYRNHRHLKHTTLMGYHYAFQILWQWLARPGHPPLPYGESQIAESVPDTSNAPKQHLDHAESPAQTHPKQEHTQTN